MFAQPERLLDEIRQAANNAAKALSDQHYVEGRVYLRHKVPWPWRTRKVRMWRIVNLSQPLWLGDDGVIYRACGPWVFADYPTYWMRAEIERRSEKGLERILEALTL